MKIVIYFELSGTFIVFFTMFNLFEKEKIKCFKQFGTSCDLRNSKHSLFLLKMVKHYFFNCGKKDTWQINSWFFRLQNLLSGYWHQVSFRREIRLATKIWVLPKKANYSINFKDFSVAKMLCCWFLFQDGCNIWSCYGMMKWWRHFLD